MTEDFQRRGLTSSDLEDYSARIETEQPELQRNLAGVYEEAARKAGLDRSRWAIQSAGDGELAVLPLAQSLIPVIDEFPRALSEALAANNEIARPAMRMRMRLALHEGLCRSAAGGFAGAGVITVSRMVDSDIARAALRACPEANLVVLLSPMLYNEYVVQGHTSLSGQEYREVEIKTKKFTGTAWMYLPGQNVHGLALDVPPSTSDSPAREPEPPARPEPATFTTTIRDVHGDGHVFGAVYQSGR